MKKLPHAAQTIKDAFPKDLIPQLEQVYGKNEVETIPNLLRDKDPELHLSNMKTYKKLDDLLKHY